jgi:hypothetical protein
MSWLSTSALLLGCFAGGWALWTLFEYVLHRWAFHALKGHGLGSREHLLHHVHASWHFDPVILLAWLGVWLVGGAWAALFASITNMPVGIAIGSGWVVGYFFYEWHHRASHLRAPRNSWERWVRKNHFQHHFGHPTLNQGVTLSVWDHVFRTSDPVDKVRVPRRLAMPWLFDDNGELREEFAEDYVIIGTQASTDERQAKIDKARAWKNLEPIP